jgi:fatty-acyl-CoA synthase
MDGSLDSSGNMARKAWMRALERTAPIARNEFVTLPTLIDDLAKQFGDAPALLSEGQYFTYRDLSERANQYARWALEQGLEAGDVVCLLMQNCPEYVAIWLGVTRVGGIVSLLNVNLVGGSLAHCISVVQPKHVIVGADLADNFAAVRQRLPTETKMWVFGPCSHDLRRIDTEVERLARDVLGGTECRQPSIMDRALYIYTSGTTGLPKAAKVSHFRIMQWSQWFAGMMDTSANDRMFNCLPMYHSVGGVVAIGSTLVSGGSVVLRKRFSAARFWDDITKWDCTLFQYIGELCRYLLQSPPHPLETEHGIRLCCGNGLRPDVWEPFKQRFHIPRILEFYAATEGNFSLYNCEGKPGAVGRIPPFLAARSQVAIVKLDPDTGELVRDSDGFCARCSAGEVGEALGKVPDEKSTLGGRFEGYTDKAATARKIARDVFARGDTWVRTGDLMRRDEAGFFYFVDRVGDTFRWKGENVSTIEVSSVLASCPGIVEAVVYGVAVPGTEGRAGMAAVVAGREFDPAVLHQHLAERLPAYARPLFLRVCTELDKTATFKPKKQDLAREGYDPASTADAIYYNDPAAGRFVRIDADLYGRIQGTERALAG